METLMKIVAALLMVVVIVLILSVPVWALWNWLIPTLFNGPEVTLLQSAGLTFLARFLFGTGTSNSSK